MELFVAICLDRHIDEYVRVFSTYEKALECCNNFTEDEEDLVIEELTQFMIQDNWMYFATYCGGEGDSVRIEKRVLDLDE